MCTSKRFIAIDKNVGSVTECECGTIHLTMGVVSLALNAAMLQRLHELIGTALDTLASDSEAELAAGTLPSLSPIVH